MQMEAPVKRKGGSSMVLLREAFGVAGSCQSSFQVSVIGVYMLAYGRQENTADCASFNIPYVPILQSAGIICALCLWLPAKPKAHCCSYLRGLCMAGAHALRALSPRQAGHWKLKAIQGNSASSSTNPVMIAIQSAYCFLSFLVLSPVLKEGAGFSPDLQISGVV